MKRRYPAVYFPPIFLLSLFLTSFAACASTDSDRTESEDIADLLQLRPGTHLADLGAGDGDWAADLLPRLGSDGKVWATEVEDDLVDDLRQRFAEDGRVQVVLGDDTHSGLPAGCCDAILARLVYHHFTDPAAMQEELCRALRPQGRLLIVDIRPQEDWSDLEGVPDRGGHGIAPRKLIDEMTAAGFTVVEQVEDWPGDADRYAVLFSGCRP